MSTSRLPDALSILAATPKGELSARTLAYELGVNRKTVMDMIKAGHLEIVRREYSRDPMDRTGTAIVRAAR